MQVICIGLINFCILKVYLVFTNSEAIISDLGIYEAWSQDILSNKEPHHLPVFPIMVWFFRLITFGIFDTLAYMQLIALFAWIFLCIQIEKILHLILNEKYQKHALILIAFFPVFGFSFVLYPAPDKLSHLAIAVMFLGYLTNSKTKFIVAGSLGLLIHKAMWPYILIMIAAGIIKRKINIYQSLVIFLPIIIYYKLVTVNNPNNELNIFINFFTDFGLKNGISIPFYELYKGLEFTTLKTFIKSFYLLVISFVALYLMIINTYQRNVMNVLILLPILMIGGFITEKVLSGFLRHSVFIIIPIFSSARFKLVKNLILNLNSYILLVLLLISQAWFLLIIYS